KSQGPLRKYGALAFLLFGGCLLEKRVGQKALPFERCAATAPRVKHAVVHHLPGIKLVRNLSRKAGVFCYVGNDKLPNKKSPLALTSEGAS
ncbi:hypothetical protein, partial [Ewingella americana]|uniref:hypothetical protein n=1 Tax=Ewingella americana TaxID=41202 RepID=UPI001E2E1A0C